MYAYCSFLLYLNLCKIFCNAFPRYAEFNFRKTEQMHKMYIAICVLYVEDAFMHLFMRVFILLDLVPK